MPVSQVHRPSHACQNSCNVAASTTPTLLTPSGFFFSLKPWSVFDVPSSLAASLPHHHCSSVLAMTHALTLAPASALTLVRCRPLLPALSSPHGPHRTLGLIALVTPTVQLPYHLTYLTSTSPRIREIMVMDGGLERLVRMLHDICVFPPPSENPAFLYCLLPPNYHLPKLVPTLIPKSFDKHAAPTDSRSLSSVVNIGHVGQRRSECRLAPSTSWDTFSSRGWRAKGLLLGQAPVRLACPGRLASKRAARKQAQAEMRARQQVLELTRALERRSEFSHDSFQTIRGRSHPSELTIWARTISTRVIAAPQL
jgi:hypothetical protein